MSEVLGPDVTIEINASNLRAESGDLTIDIQAPRASGSFVGTMLCADETAAPGDQLRHMCMGRADEKSGDA